MRKLTIAILILVSIILLAGCHTSPAEPLIPKWNGTADTTWYKDGDKEYTLDKPEQLAGLAKLVNEGNEFVGVTIKMAKDMNLDNKLWTPIGCIKFDDTNVSLVEEHSFKGTFDGNGKTIYNLKVDNERASGFFGDLRGNLLNLKIENFDIKSTHYAGALVGYIGIVKPEEALIKNCSVENGKILVVPFNKGTVESPVYDDGDKAGGIVGMAAGGTTIDGCSVNNLEITAYRDVGGLIGAAVLNQWTENEIIVKNCTVKNSKIKIDSVTNAYLGNAPTTAGEYIGREAIENDVLQKITIENYTKESVTVIRPN